MRRWRRIETVSRPRRPRSASAARPASTEARPPSQALWSKRDVMARSIAVEMPIAARPESASARRVPKPIVRRRGTGAKGGASVAPSSPASEASRDVSGEIVTASDKTLPSGEPTGSFSTTGRRKARGRFEITSGASLLTPHHSPLAYAKRSPIRNSRARSRRIWGAVRAFPSSSRSMSGGRKRTKRRSSPPVASSAAFGSRGKSPG